MARATEPEAGEAARQEDHEHHDHEPDRHEIEVEAKYIGFTIPNHFVVGYGLDVGELYRNLPFIGVPEVPENLIKN